MPIEIPPEKLEENSNVILKTLQSFGGPRYVTAAAVRAITDNLAVTQAKPILKQLVKGREELFREKLGMNPFLSEAGAWGKYQWAIATTAAHMASVDGTPISELELATFGVMDLYMPNYFRTEGTMDLPDRPVPLHEAKPRHDFRKSVEKVLIKMTKGGHVDYEVNRGIVRREEVDPVAMTVDFWKDILHRSSSFKRNVATIKASLHSPHFADMYSLIRDVHLGREFGFRPIDCDKWWILIGKPGAKLAFRDVDDRVYLQFEKPMRKGVDWKTHESESFRNVMQTITMLPFVSKEQLQYSQPQAYSTAVRIWNQTPDLSPVEIVGSYVSRKLANQLRWSSPEALTLEQNNVRAVLGQVWQYLKPKSMEEITEASDVVITALSDLQQGRTFSARTRMEERAMGALSAYVEKTNGGYQAKKGMEDALDSIALYVGKL